MKILDFIVCDDIRQEVGGKVTLVGVYDDRIMINAPGPAAVKWPVQLKLGFFIRMFNDGNCTDADGFELQVFFDDKMLSSLKGGLHFSPERTLINLLFVNTAMRFPGEGYLSVKILFKKGPEILREVNPDLRMKVGVARPSQQQVTRH